MAEAILRGLRRYFARTRRCPSPSSQVSTDALATASQRIHTLRTCLRVSNASQDLLDTILPQGPHSLVEGCGEECRHPRSFLDEGT